MDFKAKALKLALAVVSFSHVFFPQGRLKFLGNEEKGLEQTSRINKNCGIFYFRVKIQATNLILDIRFVPLNSHRKSKGVGSFNENVRLDIVFLQSSFLVK